MKYKCPQCLKEIEKDEEKCPNCGKVLLWDGETPETLEERARKKSGCFFLAPGLYAPLLFLIVLILFALIFTLSGD